MQGLRHESYHLARFASGSRTASWHHALRRGFPKPRQSGARELCAASPASGRAEGLRTEGLGATGSGGGRRPLTLFERGAARLLGPLKAGEEHWLLRLLGYYSEESRLIATANGLYARCRRLSRAPTVVRGLGLRAPAEMNFAARYEMLAVQVYLTLWRLRRAKGSASEAPARRVMQDFFDSFWSDLRYRMLIKEEGFKLLQSAKWVKECEERFFGMAMAFDQAVENLKGREAEIALAQCIKRNITSLGQNEEKVQWLMRYMLREMARLQRLPENALVDASVWPSS